MSNTPDASVKPTRSGFDRQAALAPIAAARSSNKKVLEFTFLQRIAATGSKKRTLSLLSDEDEDATSGDGSDAHGSPRRAETAAVAAAAESKKQRKPTHVLRKETKEKLLEELRHLEARAALLRQETGMADPRELDQRFALSADLREAILQQDLMIANSQSAFTGFAKIRDANRFLVERTRHVNPFKASSELSQFETEEGDYCMIKVDVTPFEGVRSVQQVFDAMQFYYANLELSLTDLSGGVTIRENDDNVADQAILHHRLVTAERSGAYVEKNAVIFVDKSDFATESVETQWAITVGDFVNQDDLYPYCPRSRIRKESTSVSKLTAYRRPRRAAPANSASALAELLREDDDDSEIVVVLTRWHLMRMVKPTFDVPKDVFHAIASEQSSALNVMLRSMRQGVFSSPAAASWNV
ncbi:hypothetical protein PybrP1_003476 [[Pythium] brassicae (nom. inval.)]|nr:hypothetical protein PybrP1_003476 [[Pythium] brassicae (nom. inval.)]